MLDSVAKEQTEIIEAIRGLNPNRRIDERVKLMVAKAFSPVSPDRVLNGCWKVIDGRMRCAYQWRFKGDAYQLVLSYDASSREGARFELTKRVVS